MRGKELNSGIRGGLWDEKHTAAMGAAVWLFGWLVHRQTTERGGVGLVLRGRPLSYREISEDTGWGERKLRYWMGILRRGGYIEVRHSIYSRMVIRVLKAKKFFPRQLDLLRFTQASTASTRPPGGDMPTPAWRLKQRAEIHFKKKAAAGPAGCGNPQKIAPVEEPESRRAENAPRDAAARSGCRTPARCVRPEWGCGVEFPVIRPGSRDCGTSGVPRPEVKLVEKLSAIVGAQAWRPLGEEAYIRRAQEQRQRLAAYLAARARPDSRSKERVET